MIQTLMQNQQFYVKTILLINILFHLMKLNMDHILKSNIDPYIAIYLIHVFIVLNGFADFHISIVIILLLHISLVIILKLDHIHFLILFKVDLFKYHLQDQVKNCADLVQLIYIFPSSYSLFDFLFMEAFNFDQSYQYDYLFQTKIIIDQNNLNQSILYRWDEF